jgi:hypothetical protein
MSRHTRSGGAGPGRGPGDTGARVAGHRMVGSALFGLGRLVESREHFEAGLALCDPLSDQN